MATGARAEAGGGDSQGVWDGHGHTVLNAAVCAGCIYRACWVAQGTLPNVM